MTTFLTVKQFAQLQPAFSATSLRHLIFDADKNGLNKAGAIKRVGKKVIIDVDRFLNWIESGATA
jgi:hypothetical protein